LVEGLKVFKFIISLYSELCSTYSGVSGVQHVCGCHIIRKSILQIITGVSVLVSLLVSGLEFVFVFVIHRFRAVESVC